MFVHTGDYTEHKTDTPLHSSYYTFTPRPLMDGGFYTMTDDLASLLTATHRNIGILEGMLLPLKDNESLTILIMLKESCFNKMIDYPNLDLNSVLLNRGIGKSDDEINNITLAYHRVLSTTADKISCDDIVGCTLHGNNSKQRIYTRSSQIFLSKSISNYRQYNPAAPKDIHYAMIDIGRYAELDGIDVLIKATMYHYQFEMIHPYEHYNGIVGRLLVYKMLYSAGLNGVRFLSLSECLYNHKAEYFEKLGQTQKSGNYTAWIEFFTRIICEAAQNGIKSTKHFINIIHTDEEKVISTKSTLNHLIDVYNYFKTNIVSTVSQISVQLQLSFNVASRAIETLQRLGILTQVTEQSRNRVFAHADLLRLFLSE